MFLEVRFGSSGMTTVSTLVGFLSGVDSDVPGKIGLRSESFGANLTHVLLGRVNLSNEKFDQV